MTQTQLKNFDHLYAGLWKRGIAFLIDFVITIVPILALMELTGLYKINREWTGVGINLVHLTLYWLYYSLLQSSDWQGTIGKKITGLKVTDMNGFKISFRQSSIRFFCMLISVLTVGIGFILIAFNPKRQALHDKLAGTIVLEKQYQHQTI